MRVLNDPFVQLDQLLRFPLLECLPISVRCQDLPPLRGADPHKCVVKEITEAKSLDKGMQAFQFGRAVPLVAEEDGAFALAHGLQRHLDGSALEV